MSLIRKIYIAVWALYLVAVLFLSFATFEGDGFDKLSTIPYIDKVVHFFMYFFLTAFGVGYIFISGYKKRYIWIYVLCVIALSGAVELLQPYMGRSCDLFDFIANTTGAIFATALVFAFRDVIQRFYSRSHCQKKDRN